MSASCPELTVLPREEPPEGGNGGGNGDQPAADRLSPLVKTLLGASAGGAVGLVTALAR